MLLARIKHHTGSLILDKLIITPIPGVVSKEIAEYLQRFHGDTVQVMDLPDPEPEEEPEATDEKAKATDEKDTKKGPQADPAK